MGNFSSGRRENSFFNINFVRLCFPDFGLGKFLCELDNGIEFKI